jgi:hypothetical protein
MLPGEENASSRAVRRKIGFIVESLERRVLSSASCSEHGWPDETDSILRGRRPSSTVETFSLRNGRLDAESTGELRAAEANLPRSTALCREIKDEFRLATCDGPPDYTYQAVYTEATALLGT